MTKPEWTKNYQPGVPAEIDLPDEPLSAMFARAARKGGKRVALEFFGATTTYRELADQVDRAAAGLAALGVGPGDRVAIVLPNCPQHVVAFYAVLRLGAVVVEHNPLYTATELATMFADHGARVAIAWDVAVPKLPTVEHVVAVNLLEAFPTVKRLALHLPVPKLAATRKRLHAKAPGTTPWKQLMAHKPIRNWAEPTASDLAVVQYTSGTIGAFKGAMLTHRNLYANALQGAAWMKDAKDGKETIYAVLPMFHAFGMTLYLTFGMLKRARIVLFPTFDVDMVLDAAKKRPPTVYCAVPPIYEKTARRAIERKVSLKSARFCISGAMKLTDPVVELWESVSGGLLVEGYGLTETAPVALGNPFWPTRRTGTIGVPFPSTLMRVVDPDDPTREVAQGEEGELLLKGPQVFSGYWNAPEETAKALLPDGWLRTGDVVVVDADGFTTIVDRLKEIIVTGGFNVSPSEVEHVLVEHPDISDVAVVGLQTESGEQVAAAVVLREGAHLDVAAVRAWAKERLAAYKVPRSFVEVEELPKSMLGKVLRKQVRESITSAS
ncbi:long-chain-fatty-acid--CoA ligase [Propioniciclava sp. MC1683]|uniref:long-chain-fatty-acid--CoA ligase n=1 Tax=Propioniciclava sp. MC1683 TaxID=2760309 RepID=UPI002814B710|nr:long-chain-fatty-acid--CoA ligase [Propioniciclava sp. MC1683]